MVLSECFNTAVRQVANILGIEFMAAAQALDFRDYKFGKGVTKANSALKLI